MKIPDSNLNNVTNAAQQAIQPSTSNNGRGGNSNSVTSRDDRVQLSSLSNTLKTLTSSSPEREARIGQLAAAYQGGSYAVNAAAVSGSMVSDALGTR